MMCKRCGVRPISPSNLRACRYRCWKCRISTPGAAAARLRYRQSDKWRAVVARVNKQRIWVGHDYHSYAATPAQAAAINAHVRGQRHAFIARFADGKEAQGAAARGVPTEAAV